MKSEIGNLQFFDTQCQAMAAHPNGGASYSGNLTVLGDITAQSVTASISGAVTLTNSAPAAANSTGTAGTIAYDSGFIYVCVSTDTWKRVAIATW